MEESGGLREHRESEQMKTRGPIRGAAKWRERIAAMSRRRQWLGRAQGLPQVSQTSDLTIMPKSEGGAMASSEHVDTAVCKELIGDPQEVGP